MLNNHLASQQAMVMESQTSYSLPIVSPAGSTFLSEKIYVKAEDYGDLTKYSIIVPPFTLTPSATGISLVDLPDFLLNGKTVADAYAQYTVGSLVLLDSRPINYLTPVIGTVQLYWDVTGSKYQLSYQWIDDAGNTASLPYMGSVEFSVIVNDTGPVVRAKPVLKRPAATTSVSVVPILPKVGDETVTSSTAAFANPTDGDDRTVYADVVYQDPVPTGPGAFTSSPGHTISYALNDGELPQSIDELMEVAGKAVEFLFNFL
jgi:hypothetical protein